MERKRIDEMKTTPKNTKRQASYIKIPTETAAFLLN